jgi:hypothetical protein
MAKITKGENRLIEADYHIYGQAVGGDGQVLVRRQLALPQDVIHPASCATRLQRDRIAKAGHDWANLNLAEKMYWRDQIRWSPRGEVLRGEKLYVSLHVDAQRVAQAQEEPFIAQPSADLAPCVVVCLPDHTPLLAAVCGLVKKGTITFWKSAKEISLGHYRFDNLPGTFQPSVIWVTHGFAEPWIHGTITTRSQLQRAYYVKMGYVSRITVSTFQWLPFHSYGMLHGPNYALLEAHGDTFKASGDFPVVGHYEAVYTLTIEDGVMTHASLYHYHQPNTTFRFRIGQFSGSDDFICERNIFGYHDCKYIKPYLSLAPLPPEFR